MSSYFKKTGIFFLLFVFNLCLFSCKKEINKNKTLFRINVPTKEDKYHQSFFSQIISVNKTELVVYLKGTILIDGKDVSINQQLNFKEEKGNLWNTNYNVSNKNILIWISRKCSDLVLKEGKYNDFLNYSIAKEYREINFYHINGYDYLIE